MSTSPIAPRGGRGRWTASAPRRVGSAWRRRAGAVAACLLIAAATAPWMAAPAHAHAQGLPQTVTLSLAAADVVRAQWKVGSIDDLSWIALDAGLLPADRVLLDGGIVPESSDAQILQDSAGFDDYLLKNITVTVGGTACTGAVADKSDVAARGATILYTCGQAVTDATVGVSLLTDLDPQYSSIVTGQDGRSTVYTGQATSAEWSFDPSSVSAAAQDGGTTGGTPVATTVLIAAGIAVPITAGFLVLLRRRRAAMAVPGEGARRQDVDGADGAGGAPREA